MSTDDAARAADTSLQQFISAMARAHNPGAGTHEVGMHKVEGWVFEYDSTIGGAEVQGVIGLDGAVHVRRAARSMRAEKLTGAEFVRHDGNENVAARAQAFADRLAEILAFNGVSG